MPALDDILNCRGPWVMGILNVTPDSFSDSGRFADRDDALDQAWQMLADGAAIIDIGAESTRPGSSRVSAEEQLARLNPLLSDICNTAHNAGALVSLDTTLAEVAQAGLDVGVDILNDVSAGRDDPAMLPLAAERQTPIVLMHMLGEPKSMQQSPDYDDVAQDVTDFLLERVGAATAAGLPREKCILDPGIGFGKTTAHNLTLLSGVNKLAETGLPVLIGPSRKRFIGEIANQADPSKRLGGTIASCLETYRRGASIFRVHDVLPTVQAFHLVSAINDH